jgi:hypothetical protein
MTTCQNLQVHRFQARGLVSRFDGGVGIVGVSQELRVWLR